MDEDPSASVVESLSPLAFEPSVPTEEPVPQAKLQQTGVFSDTAVPEFDEQDYQSECYEDTVFQQKRVESETVLSLQCEWKGRVRVKAI